MWYDHEMAHKLVSDRCTVSLGARGRLVLPSAIRKRLALREGDRVILIVGKDGGVTLVPMAEAVRRSRGMFKHLAPPGRSLVDEFIAERHAEAAKEDER